MAQPNPIRSPARRARFGPAGAWTAWAAVVAVVLVLLAGPLAGAAGAHASVAEVRPAPAAALETSPSRVAIWFTEGVDVGGGGVFVYDSGGNRVPVGDLRQPTPERLLLPITDDLPDGSYIVTYRVVSKDTHPIQGTWTFQVGDASTTAAEVRAVSAGLLAGQRADRVVSVAWAAARWSVFAAMALLVGGAVFAAAVWPRARTARATRWIVGAGWLGLFVATVLGVLLFAAYSRGGSIADAVDPSVVGDTLGSRFGWVWLARLVVLVLALPVLRVLLAPGRDRPAPLPRWWVPASIVPGAALVTTPGLAGHASTGDRNVLSLLADAAHVTAMAVWLGGLVVLAAVGLRSTDPDAIRTVSRRFSRVALACVGVLVVTGAYQTWRLVGGLDALRDEEYGRILVIKLVVFAVMLVVASFSREIVQRIYGDAAPVPAVRGGALDLTDDAGVATAGGPADARAARREVARLRRSVWSEVALGALVLVVTALLVNAVPPADISGAGSATTGVTIEHPEVTLDVTATPGVAGLNDLHVSTYSPAGAPLDVAAVELTLALPGRGIAPLSVPLRELGPGHYLSPGLDLPLAGDWRLTATVRLGPVDRVDLAGDLPIR